MIVKIVVLLLFFKASNIRCQNDEPNDEVDEIKIKIPDSETKTKAVAYNCQTNATTEEYFCSEPTKSCDEKCSDNVSCCPEDTCCQSTDVVKNIADRILKYIQDYSLLTIGGAVMICISILCAVVSCLRKCCKTKEPERRHRN